MSLKIKQKPPQVSFLHNNKNIACCNICKKQNPVNSDAMKMNCVQRVISSRPIEVAQWWGQTYFFYQLKVLSKSSEGSKACKISRSVSLTLPPNNIIVQHSTCQTDWNHFGFPQAKHCPAVTLKSSEILLPVTNGKPEYLTYQLDI